MALDTPQVVEAWVEEGVAVGEVEDSFFDRAFSKNDAKVKGRFVE